ncbi:MAG: hypothetical protein V7749_00665 [Cocleimonas sp.]
MNIITSHICNAAEIATDLLFKEMCISSFPIMIAVEDSRKDGVVGFSKVFIAKDYYHTELCKCSNNGKLHIRRDWSIVRIKTEVFDFLRGCHILPFRLDIEGEIVKVEALHQDLKDNIGYYQASRKVERIQLQHSKIEVIKLD